MPIQRSLADARTHSIYPPSSSSRARKRRKEKTTSDCSRKSLAFNEETWLWSVEKKNIVVLLWWKKTHKRGLDSKDQSMTWEKDEQTLQSHALSPPRWKTNWLSSREWRWSWSLLRRRNFSELLFEVFIRHSPVNIGLSHSDHQFLFCFPTVCWAEVENDRGT